MKALRIKRLAVSICGVVFLSAGICLGILWFWLLLPFRHCVDYNGWWARHTDADRWQEVQKCIRHIGWQHDDCFNVGYWGDKNWAARIIAELRPGEDVESCSSGHRALALQLITNQEVGETANAWLAWWTNNKNKSQEEWILDGFRRQGLDLQKPLIQKDIRALLTLVGEYRFGMKNPVSCVTDYNAKRWLRDSDFEPAKFNVSELHGDKENETLRGLVRYAQWAESHPKNKTAGVLAIGRPPNALGTLPSAVITGLEFRLGVPTSVMILGLAGVWLLRRTWRARS